jgi:predicted RNase H-like HicB family nuclease
MERFPPPTACAIIQTMSNAKRGTFNLHLKLYRETDRRWLADIPALPGVTAYGRTRKQAMAAAQALALRLLGDRLEHGEAVPGDMMVSFVAA